MGKNPSDLRTPFSPRVGSNGSHGPARESPSEHRPPALETTDDETGALWSPRLETAVVGAFLAPRDEDRAQLDRVEDLLDPSMFGESHLGIIYSAILRLRSRGDASDVLSVEHELRQMGDLQAVGGIDVLADLVDAVPSAASVESHARVVEG